jgi:signal peptidase I
MIKKLIKHKNIILIIINILIIRSFIIEPFRIPSGSMIPTLLPGDFILVNKFYYGIKMPLINKKILDINKPQKGDIIVFIHKNKKKYIKRIIGIEGDKLEYKNKELKINNIKINNKKLSKNIDIDNMLVIETAIHKEYLTPQKKYNIQTYENIKNYNSDIEIEIPKNSFFVMGDNRDNSEDSRVWGFVTEKDLIGKAIIVWSSVDLDNYVIRTDRIIKKIK